MMRPASAALTTEAALDRCLRFGQAAGDADAIEETPGLRRYKEGTALPLDEARARQLRGEAGSIVGHVL
jgi:hypothetical protein